MRVKLFTFRYSATLGGFDDTVLQDFVRSKEVLTFREHFFTVNDLPHLACVLVWQDAVISTEDLDAARPIPPVAPRSAPASDRTNDRRFQRNGSDPTAGLSEPERVLFNTLREWRSKKAHDEGVPPYLIFTNRHLIEIVRKRPESPTALSNLNGIGRGKVERYATELLRVMHGGRTESASATPVEAAPTVEAAP